MVSTDEEQMIAPQPPPLAGYGDFELLGSGGAGLVWKASKSCGSIVAIKVIRHDNDDSHERAVRQLLNEARLAASFEHPYLVRVLDVVPEVPCYVMEYVPGCNLYDWVTQHDEPLPLLTALFLACQITDAVRCLHDAGIVHRDIKPGNVLLHIESEKVVEARLADFGLSYALRTRDDEARAALVGTYDFVAPERTGEMGKKLALADLLPEEQLWLDQAGDQYSLAATLLFAVTGKIIKNEPTVDEELPPALRAVLVQALQGKPENRIASVAAFFDALLEILNAELVRQHARAGQLLRADQLHEAIFLIQQIPEPLLDLQLQRELAHRVGARREQLYDVLEACMGDRDYSDALDIVNELLWLAHNCGESESVIEQLMEWRDEVLRLLRDSIHRHDHHTAHRGH